MERQGRVIGVEQGKRESKAEVKVIKTAACGHCSGCSGSPRTLDKVTIYSDKQIEVGDFIKFQIKEKKFIKIIFIIYILPVIFMFLGYFGGSRFGGSEGYGILGSFTGLFIAFGAIYLIDKYYKQNVSDIRILSVTKELE